MTTRWDAAGYAKGVDEMLRLTVSHAKHYDSQRLKLGKVGRPRHRPKVRRSRLCRVGQRSATHLMAGSCDRWVAPTHPTTIGSIPWPLDAGLAGVRLQR